MDYRVDFNSSSRQPVLHLNVIMPKIERKRFRSPKPLHPTYAKNKKKILFSIISRFLLLSRLIIATSSFVCAQDAFRRPSEAPHLGAAPSISHVSASCVVFHSLIKSREVFFRGIASRLISPITSPGRLCPGPKKFPKRVCLML